MYITQSFKIPAKYNYHYTFNTILLVYSLADWHLLTINSMEISPADYNAAKCYKNNKIKIIPYSNVGVLCTVHFLFATFKNYSRNCS